MNEAQQNGEGVGQLTDPSYLGMGTRGLRAILALLRPCISFVSVCVALLFLGALFWAREQDPFVRKWFRLKTADNRSVKCIAVLPKPIRQRPVLIYAHGWGGNLTDDAFVLRQMAELGLAVVSLEYNQTNASEFPAEMEAVQQYLARAKWADTHVVAWVGFSQGANRMQDFVMHHPVRQPQQLVQLNGAGLNLSSNLKHPFSKLRCPVLFIHSDRDEIFPIADAIQLTSLLRTNGVPVQLKIIHGLAHGLKTDRGVVFRYIGEYCRTHLLESNGQSKEAVVTESEIKKGLATSATTGDSPISKTKQTENEVWRNYHSLAQWQAESPPFWLFCLPAAAWAVGYYAWRCYRNPASVKKIKFHCHEIALRWLSAVLGVWALAEIALHLVPPHLVVSSKIISVARRYLIQPKECDDYDFLANQPIWQGQKLRTLLDHVELAGYNRVLINWKLDEEFYQDYVLSPVIEPPSILNPQSSNFNWRRPLWEEFYPRIRHEASPLDAARVVVRHLRERVTIAALPNLPHSVPEIWLRQITDRTGFEIIYVAALRSVGVPARLNSKYEAEFYEGSQWQPAPWLGVDSRQNVIEGGSRSRGLSGPRSGPKFMGRGVCSGCLVSRIPRSSRVSICSG